MFTGNMSDMFTTSEIIKYDNKCTNSDFLALIADKNSTQLRELCFKIMEIKDPFHSLSLLLRIYTNKPFINSLFMERLSSLVREVKGEKYLKIKNLDERVYWLMMRHAEENDVQAMIHCASIIKINGTKLEELKRYFSYSLVYQYYKSICKNIFKEKYRRQEIALVIRLMDSASLCFKNLYPVIKKISKCARQKSIDKSVIECAKLLGCVIKYEPRAVHDHQDYVTSVLSFLCGVLTDIKNYVFLGLEDLNEIVIAVGRICEYEKDNFGLSKLLTGLYANSYDIIYKYNKIRAHLEEDLVCLTVNLQLVRILYRVTYHQGLRAFNYNQFYNDIVNLKYGKPVNLSMRKYRRVLSTFYASKYRLLDMVYDDQCFNTDMLIADISMCSDFYGVLKNLKRLLMKLELDKLIRIGVTAVNTCGDVHCKSGNGDLSNRAGEQRNVDKQQEENTYERRVADGSVSKYKRDENAERNLQQAMSGEKNGETMSCTVKMNGSKSKNNETMGCTVKMNGSKSKNNETMGCTVKMNGSKSKNGSDATAVKNDPSFDEKNYVFLIKFALKRCFLDQNDFKANVELYKKFLVDKGPSLVLLATSAFARNMEDLKYTDAHLDLLSFMFVLHLNDRNNRIVRKKEKVVIAAYDALANGEKIIFMKNVFTNLENLKYYEFNPFLVSFVLTFDKEVEKTENVFIKYFLNALEWNKDKEERACEADQSDKDGDQVVMDTYSRIYVSLVCYVCMKYRLRTAVHLTSYYGVIVMLINCIEQPCNDDYVNAMKTNILGIVFDLDEKRRDDVKALYSTFLKDKESENMSDYLRFYRKFSKKMEKKMKRSVDRKR